MNVLLTFTGFHDPFSPGLVAGEEQTGPILSLLAARPFDRVYLFSTPTTDETARATGEEIEARHPETRVEILDTPLEDPTDYLAILRGIRTHYRAIRADLGRARLYVAVASGTPQMHACWVLLTASGEIPARILHVRPPRFVTRKSPLVSEVDLEAPAFPAVVRRDEAPATDGGTGGRDFVRERWRLREARGPEAGVGLDAAEGLPRRGEDASAGPDAAGPDTAGPDAARDPGEAAALIGIIGDHPALREAIDVVALLAPSDAPILIYGETGTGKELFSRLVHRLSGRDGRPFVPINCAAIPESLVESVLFGHRRGAFTGAHADRAGTFDRADGGTLFLDELGELPVSVQARLLRVLEDGIVEPVGASKPHRVDVRIVAATNRDLPRMIRKGTFREDLYYRLNVGEVRLPPLRERRSDIAALTDHILGRLNRSLKRRRRISRGALKRLEEHPWPGNVRDLENVIERSVRMCGHDVLEADDLLITEAVTTADPLDGLPEPRTGFSLEAFLGSARKQLILRALEATQGNQSRAARLLGISPQAVHKFVKRSADASTGVEKR